MIFLLLRLIVLGAFVAGIVFLVQWMMKPSDGMIRCERCEGKGFWYGARGKEKCDWCRGSGRMPRM